LGRRYAADLSGSGKKRGFIMLKLQFRDDPGNFVKLSVSTVTLGRDESNDVVIDSPSVSDFHAEIISDAQGPWIIDLLSATGTFVNERRIVGRCQLRAWDVIRLGTFDLEVIDPNTRRPEDWALRTESDLLASQFYSLQARTVVGRDPACDLTIDSNLLSRRHAELIIEDDHLRVIDLDSANGTFLNGQKIEEGSARPGDELRFDRQRFIVIGPSPPKPRQEDGVEVQTQVRGVPSDATVFVGAVESGAAGGANEGGDTQLMATEETRFFVPPPSPAVLVELSADLEQRRTTLENELYRIGRSNECDIVVENKSVSKLHAELAFVEGDWFVKDLGSSNGVLVNGERVEEARLESGDRLQLGRMDFEFTVQRKITDENDLATMIYRAPMPEREIGRATPAADKPVKSGSIRWLAGAIVIGLVAIVVIFLFSKR